MYTAPATKTPHDDQDGKAMLTTVGCSFAFFSIFILLPHLPELIPLLKNGPHLIKWEVLSQNRFGIEFVQKTMICRALATGLGSN